LARPEDRDAGVAERVRQARHERRLRPDDGEVDRQLATEAEQTFGIFRADRMALAEPGDAGVPGRSVQSLEARALGELPGKRVLATPGADDQDPHAASLLTVPARKASAPLVL
jgi:hypothetical protein